MLKSVANDFIRQRNEITKKYTGHVIYPNDVPLDGFDSTLWLQGLLNYNNHSLVFSTKIDPLCVASAKGDESDIGNCTRCYLQTSTICSSSDSGVNKVRRSTPEKLKPLVTELDRLIFSTLHECLTYINLGSLHGEEATYD